MKGRPDDAVVLVCGADARYACPLAVLLRSVTETLARGRRIEVRILDGGLSESLRERVTAGLDLRGGTVRWLRPDRSRWVGLPVWGRMSVATYDKLLLGELLEPEVERALWLDADILAVGDVAPLWDLDLGDRLALAVRDDLVPTLGAPFGVAGHRELGLDGGQPYFNAGVMLVDVAGWRREAVLRRSLEYLQRFHRGVYFWDQEALNAVLAGRWGALDPGWNVGPARMARWEAARLLHFSGNLKPWAHESRSPVQERYLDVLDRTSWRGCRPTGRGSAWAGWYQASPLRRWLRPLEPWGMRGWRWRTLRRAGLSDLGNDARHLPGRLST